ncbi:uncharacterized protein LOC134254533 [Saccostrea cucullata]|uniref:uncharacterized protein LOC134254533 n=1 Tax=Saccostrea cuccullata TaxID=36930 RepID=UPI002ED5B659
MAVFFFLLSLLLGSSTYGYRYNYGYSDNMLSTPHPFVGNLLMPADLLLTTSILPAKTEMKGINYNSDDVMSFMTYMFYPKDFTMTSLATAIIEHRPSMKKIFLASMSKRKEIPGTNLSVFDDDM